MPPAMQADGQSPPRRYELLVQVEEGKGEEGPGYTGGRALRYTSPTPTPSRLRTWPCSGICRKMPRATQRVMIRQRRSLSFVSRKKYVLVLE